MDSQGYIKDLNPVAKVAGYKLEEFFEKRILNNFATNRKQLAIPGSVNPLIVAMLEKSREPKLALEFLKFVYMDKNEISEEMNRKLDNNSSKQVTEMLGDDSFYSVKINSVPFIKKDLVELNTKFLNAQADFINKLKMIVLHQTELQRELTNLAKSSDQEMDKDQNP